jgi:transposase InsO family protein
LDSEYYAKIKESAKYCRDLAIRKKLQLFLKAGKLKNVQAACQFFGVNRDYYYRWYNRFVHSGFDVKSLREKSRRPRCSPQRIDHKLVRKIAHYRKNYRYGPRRIAYWLKTNHNLCVSPSTIFREILRKKWLVKKYQTKKINPHRKRYNLDWPGQMLQMDIKYVPERINGKRFYEFNAIDDCTRWRFARIYQDKSLESCLDFATDLIRYCPFRIQCIQTDNDQVFTNRLNVFTLNPDYHPFTAMLKKQGIRHRLIPPGAKELNGKVERSHRIDDDEFFWKAPMMGFSSLKQAFAQWIWEYNHDRPHSSLGGLTPVEKLVEKMYVQIFTLALMGGIDPLSLIRRPVPYVKPTQVGTYIKYLAYLDSQYVSVRDVMEFYKMISILKSTEEY